MLSIFLCAWYFDLKLEMGSSVFEITEASKIKYSGTNLKIFLRLRSIFYFIRPETLLRSNIQYLCLFEKWIRNACKIKKAHILSPGDNWKLPPPTLMSPKPRKWAFLFSLFFIKCPTKKLIFWLLETTSILPPHPLSPGDKSWVFFFKHSLCRFFISSVIWRVVV